MHHHHPLPQATALCLQGQIVRLALQWCEPLSSYELLSQRSDSTLRSLSLGDAVLRLSSHSVATVSATFNDAFHHYRGGSKATALADECVALTFSQLVHPHPLAHLTNNPIGEFVEILVDIAETKKRQRLSSFSSSSSLSSSSLPSQTFGHDVMHLVAHNIRRISLYDLIISRSTTTAPAGFGEGGASLGLLQPTTSTFLLRVVGWVPSTFQYLVDVWCPNVAGHRHVKELLMLAAVSMRLDQSLTMATPDTNVSDHRSSPLRILLRGPKGCGKSLLLAAFQELHHAHTTLVLHHGTPPASHSGAGQPRRRNTATSSGASSCGVIDPEELLPKLVFPPSTRSALPSSSSFSRTSSMHQDDGGVVCAAAASLHAGQLLLSRVVVVDDWAILLASSSAIGSVPRYVLDTLLDDTWLLPLAPSSAPGFLHHHGNDSSAWSCFLSEHGSATGLQRGRCLVATDTLDAKQPLSAALQRSMFDKFHIIVSLEEPPIEADAAMVSAQAIRAASQLSRQRHSTLNSSRSLSVGGGFGELPSHAAKRSIGGGESLTQHGDSFLQDEFCVVDGIGQLMSGGFDHHSHTRSSSPSPLSGVAGGTVDLSAILDELVCCDSAKPISVRCNAHISVVPSWIVYLLTTAGDQHPPRQQQFIQEWLAVGGRDAAAAQQLPPLTQLLEQCIGEDLPGFVEIVASLSLARHVFDAQLPLAPDCIIDTLRVLLFATTPASLSLNGSSHGSDAGATTAAAQRKRLRCIVASDDLAGRGGAKKAVGKKQIARKLMDAIVHASRSGAYQSNTALNHNGGSCGGEVPIGVCRTLFDQVVSASGGGGGGPVLFDEIVGHLSHDGMVLRGRNGGLTPL